MENIKRPTKVAKGQKNYLTNERYQDYSENQFKTIYDYLDKYVDVELFNDFHNLQATITLSDSLANYDSIEVYWKAERDIGWILGSERIQNPDGYYFDVNTLYRKDSIRQLGNTSIFHMDGNTIELITSSLYEFGNNASPIFNEGVHVYITRVIGRKEK